jgi:hypothetical protein
MKVLASKEVPFSEMTSFPSLRKEMIERDIAARGVRDELAMPSLQNRQTQQVYPSQGIPTGHRSEVS